MAKYFTIMTGLRGCYIPDNAFIIRAETRRDLKSVLVSEAENVLSGGMGLNRKHIATITAAAWREAHKKNPSIYDYVIPYGSGKDRSFGIFVSVSSRHDWAEFTKENDDN